MKLIYSQVFLLIMVISRPALSVDKTVYDFDQIALNLLLSELLEQRYTLQAAADTTTKNVDFELALQHWPLSTDEVQAKRNEHQKILSQYLLIDSKSLGIDLQAATVEGSIHLLEKPLQCSFSSGEFKKLLKNHQSWPQQAIPAWPQQNADERACAGLSYAMNIENQRKASKAFYLWLSKVDAFAPDSVHSLLLSWLHLRLQQYDLALRYAYRSALVSPIHRYVYESMQSVYVFNEKGAGSVALKKP